jgi:hypothetical protein
MPGIVAMPQNCSSVTKLWVTRSKWYNPAMGALKTALSRSYASPMLYSVFANLSCVRIPVDYRNQIYFDYFCWYNEAPPTQNWRTPEALSAIDYICKYARFPVSASCMTNQKPDSIPAVEHWL